MVIGYIRGWENIPKDLKVLSESEAYEHQMKLIWGWNKTSEVFFLKYGNAIAGLTAGLSSLPIVSHFRKHLRLNNFGLIATYGPSVVMPSVITFFGYENLVTAKIILMKMQCPLCMQFTYAAYHICSSLFYSTAASVLTCATVATARNTRYIPSSQTEGRKLVRYFWNIIKAGSRRFQAITVVQLVIALSLPYLQVQQFSNLMELALEKERAKLNLNQSVSSENPPELQL